MKVLQTAQDLARERLRDLLIELAMFTQAAGDRTTRNIFEETVVKEQTKTLTPYPPDEM